MRCISIGEGRRRTPRAVQVGRDGGNGINGGTGVDAVDTGVGVVGGTGVDANIGVQCAGVEADTGVDVSIELESIASIGVSGWSG